MFYRSFASSSCGWYQWSPNGKAFALISIRSRRDLVRIKGEEREMRVDDDLDRAGWYYPSIRSVSAQKILNLYRPAL